MKDDYIRRQKRKIRKYLWDAFSLKYFLVFAACLLSFFLLLGWDPPPEMWKREEITIANMGHQDRPTLLSKYRNPGFWLTDQYGNLYWIDEEDNCFTVGESYQVIYVNGWIYRFFRSVEQGDYILMDYDEAVAGWKREAPLAGVVLTVFLLSLLVTIRYVIRVLSDDSIRQCREKIRKHRDKQKTER